MRLGFLSHLPMLRVPKQNSRNIGCERFERRGSGMIDHKEATCPQPLIEGASRIPRNRRKFPAEHGFDHMTVIHLMRTKQDGGAKAERNLFKKPMFPFNITVPLTARRARLEAIQVPWAVCCDEQDALLAMNMTRG